jgi:hypothetical protein
MKMRLFGSFIVIALVLMTRMVHAGDDARPHVLILGTFHWSNPHRDVADVKAPDLSSARRRQELGELLDVLKKFRPTKIAVELYPAEKSSEAAERFREFAKHPRVDDEVDQIGLRLAQQLHQRTIFGVDCPDSGQLNSLLEGAKRYGQSSDVDEVFASARQLVAQDQRILDEKSLLAYYRHLNSPQRLSASDRGYMLAARVGTPQDPVGARVVATWYERNLCIYANVARLLDGPSQRLLVIIGSGHAKLLSEFLRESGSVEVDEFERLVGQLGN